MYKTVNRPVKRTLCVTTKVTACVSVRTRIKSDRIVEVWVRYSLTLVTQILSTMQWNPRLVTHVSRPLYSDPSQHFSDNIDDVSRIPFHAIDLDSSDLTVDPFLSEYRWNDPYYDTSLSRIHAGWSSHNSYSNLKRQTVLVTQSEEIRVGMAINSTVRYPDYQIASNTQATVRIHPFGGYIQFDKSVVSLSESSESSTDECDLVVQRLNGKGGDASAVIKLITISDAGEGNVCSETTAKDLNLNNDLNLDSPYFNLTWSDQDDSDRCLNFDVVDDTIVEGDEVICVHIEQVGGTANSPRQETPTLFSL